MSDWKQQLAKSGMAYPLFVDDGEKWAIVKGLTKREVMAKDFTAALLSNPNFGAVYWAKEVLAADAIEMTNILLKELNGGEDE